jgi:hypothetical protein
MAGRKGISEASLIAALRKHGGIFVLAARELGVSRQNIKIRVDRSEGLQVVVNDVQEATLAAGEAVILDAIANKQDVATARWYLDRKGKARGYGKSISCKNPAGRPGT